MSYFDNKENALSYIKMVEGFDNDFMMHEVFTNLPLDKKMLELGIGSGHDLDVLRKCYDVTGTDKSEVFLELYREKNAETPLLKLDAVKMDIDDTFDYIYSNKVLIHLSDEDMKESFLNQLRVLNEGGLVFHSFWKGTHEEEFHGLRFNYKTKQDILDMTNKYYDLIKYKEYKEFAANDSFYIVLKKKASK